MLSEETKRRVLERMYADCYREVLFDVLAYGHVDLDRCRERLDARYAEAALTFRGASGRSDVSNSADRPQSDG